MYILRSVTIQEELENIYPVDWHTIRLVHFLMNCLLWTPDIAYFRGVYFPGIVEGRLPAVAVLSVSVVLSGVVDKSRLPTRHHGDNDVTALCGFYWPCS